MLILGIETSCDETSAAVLDENGNVYSNIISSQIEIHKKYGGIVPEVASRDHGEKIDIVVAEALSSAKITAQNITHVGVTSGPGLLGCLLVGVSFAKAFSLARNIPLIGVDHVRSHLMSVFINYPEKNNENPSYPFVGLVVSGGHSSIYYVKSYNDITPIASTVDDAAGEALDKVGRYLGLEYPSGKVIDDLSKGANSNAIKFPRPIIKDKPFDYSFSGLKTAAVNYFKQNNISKDTELPVLKDVLASFQEAVCDVLVDRLVKVAKHYNVSDVVIGGGVSANSRLRELLTQRSFAANLKSWVVPLKYCTDNAAMIANLARFYIDKDVNNFTREMSSLKTYANIKEQQ